MVIVMVVIAGTTFFYLFTPWLAIPLTLLSLVTLRAIQFKLMTNTAEHELKELRKYRKYLPLSQRMVIDSIPRTYVFFGSILLMCLGYFIPYPVPQEKKLLAHLCPLVMGALGFWYHAPSVGLSRVGGFIIAALCVGIPTLGALLGFSPFSLR